MNYDQFILGTDPGSKGKGLGFCRNAMGQALPPHQGAEGRAIGKQRRQAVQLFYSWRQGSHSCLSEITRENMTLGPRPYLQTAGIVMELVVRYLVPKV